MRKSLLIAAIMSILAVKAYADGGEYQGVPTGPGGALNSAVFVGVDRSTIVFSSASVLCFSGVGSVVGFIASSQTNSTDFLIFRDTENLILTAESGGNDAADDYLIHAEFVRIHMSTGANISGTVQAVNGDPRLGTVFKFPEPIRVYRGLAVKANSSAYNIITVLYNKLS